MQIKNTLEKNKWQWKLMEYISYLMVFVVPLYFGMNHFYVFNTPKALIITALTLLMIVLFFWGKMKDRESKIRITPLHVGLVFFMIAITISSIFGIDPLNSFLGWRQSVSLFYVYVLSIFAVFLGFLIRRNKDFLINLLLSSLASSVLVMIVFYTGIPSLIYITDGSTIGNSSYLGEYLIFNIFFGFGLFIYFKKWWKKILIAIATLFITINPLFINKGFLLGKIGLLEAIKNPVSLLGISNAATMGLGISIIVMILLFLIISRKKVFKITGFVLLVLFLLGTSYAGKELVNQDSKLYQVYTEQKTGNRFLAWDIAKINFYNNPILGSGFNNYSYSFEEYYTPDFFKDEYMIERFNQPHNVFWEFASNTGILGLLSYLAFLILIFTALFKTNKEEENIVEKNWERKMKIILASILFGYYAQNLFGFDTIVTYLILFVLVGVALGYDSFLWRIDIKNKLNYTKKVFGVVVIFASLISLVFFVYLPWKESKGWHKIMYENNNIASFDKIRSGLQETSIFGGVLDSALMGNKLFNLYQSSLYKIDETNKKVFLKEINSLYNQIEKDANRQPYSSETYFIMGKLLNLYMMTEMKEKDTIIFDGKNYNQKVWDKSKESFDRALEINPNNPLVYQAISQLYMIKGDFKNAYLYSKKDIDMAPEFKDGYDYGRNLLRIYPNKDFENYLNKMEAKWILK